MFQATNKKRMETHLGGIDLKAAVSAAKQTPGCIPIAKLDTGEN